MNIYPGDVYKPRMYALASDEGAATRTAGMLFRRGFAYVGRAADNPGQKGGFAVSTGGREFVAEAPLITPYETVLSAGGEGLPLQGAGASGADGLAPSPAALK